MNLNKSPQVFVIAIKSQFRRDNFGHKMFYTHAFKAEKEGFRILALKGKLFKSPERKVSTEFITKH